MDSDKTELNINDDPKDGEIDLEDSPFPTKNGGHGLNDVELNHKAEFQEGDLTTGEEYDTSCGVGAFRPQWLQWFGRVGVFVGVYSMSGLLTSTLVVYVNSQISMLEKQFGFSSQQSGLIMACNDIGFLCTTIFAGHIARKVHIPKGLFVSTVLFGVCGILCALPYFIQDKSVFDLDKGMGGSSNESLVSRASKSKRAPLCLTRNASNVYDTSGCAVDGGNLNAADLEQISIKKIAFALIAIGMVFQGIGKSPRYPFITLYIDDAVDKRKTGFYMGIITGTAIFGPALAYGLGGLFSRIYVTLEEVDISPRDPRWIGAWWLGFIVFGGLSVVISFPMLCFPYRLKKKGRMPMIKKRVEKKAPVNAAISELKRFLQSIGRILKNPVYMMSVTGTCVLLLGIGGTIAFLAKYIEAQFSIPLWQANIVLAVSNILAVSLGAFFGGIITRKLNMTPVMTIKVMLAFYTVNILFYISGFFLGCDQPAVFGDNVIGSGSDLYQPTGHNSSSSCVCDDAKYYPICGEDGRSYFSPCHGGCPIQNKATFQNCTMIPGGTAIGGLCIQKCNTLWAWAVLNFLGAFISALKIMPKFVLTIRSVEERDRSMATAISSFSSSALGWMLGPIIFGTLIDNSCLLWRYICTERQSCYLYDIQYLRNVIYGVGTGTRVISTLLYVIIYFIVRNKTDWRQVSQPNFEVKVEEKETAE